MKKSNIIFILAILILTLNLASAGDYRFQNLTGADLMMIRGSDGFIGMGTNSPSAKLEVNGNIISDNFNSVGLNTSVGFLAGDLNTGNYLAVIGSNSGYSNSGDFVTSIGYVSGYINSGDYLTAIGAYAGNQNSGDNVVAIGYKAGQFNSVSDQFIVKQANINAVPLIQGNFSSGNIGIGTITPSAKLDVNGRIKDQTGFVQPVGAVITYVGSSAPEGWLLCDGSPVSRATYSDLFAIAGTTYGTGDGSTTFNLPDFTDKFARGNTPSLGGGNDTHTITSAELPTHTHTINHDHPATTSGTESASHTHTRNPSGVLEYNVWTGSGSSNLVGQSGALTQITATNTGTQSTSHTHSANLPLFSGSSGNGGFANAAIDTIPAYVGINYIIKY